MLFRDLLGVALVDADKGSFHRGTPPLSAAVGETRGEMVTPLVDAK